MSHHLTRALLRSLATRLLTVIQISGGPAALATAGCSDEGGECCGNFDQSCCDGSQNFTSLDERCLAWESDAGACPSAADVGDQLGADVKSVDSEGTFADGECCYDVTVEAVSGRPFLVGDRPRVARAAPTASRGSWTAEHRPDVTGLPAALRAVLADTWVRDGLAEHASVASFARFSLELMAVGAPAELLASAHAAALDEVRHARICFALAAAYGGGAIVPGPFPVGGAVSISDDLEALAVAVAREGCIAETIAATVVAARHARATDPAVRAALGEIASDEQRHAELAWRTLAWALRTGGQRLRGRVRAELERALSGAGPASAGEELGEAAVAHGCLGADEIAKISRSALTDVVQPCFEALFRASA